MTTYLLLALTDDGRVTVYDRNMSAPNRQYPTDLENQLYRLGLYDARFRIDRRSTTKWASGWWDGNQPYFDGLLDGARWEGRMEPRGAEVAPLRTGNDRNAYSTYEVAGYSIDVRRKEPTT